MLQLSSIPCEYKKYPGLKSLLVMLCLCTSWFLQANVHKWITSRTLCLFYPDSYLQWFFSRVLLILFSLSVSWRHQTRDHRAAAIKCENKKPNLVRSFNWGKPGLAKAASVLKKPLHVGMGQAQVERWKSLLMTQPHLLKQGTMLFHFLEALNESTWEHMHLLTKFLFCKNTKSHCWFFFVGFFPVGELF